MGAILGIAIVLLAFGPAPAGAEVPALDWRIVSPLGEGGVALAYDPASGRLAVGDARGLSIGTPGEALRRVGVSGPVRDVAFAGSPQGWWLAATETGLFRIDAQARVRSVAPAPGHAARDVVRIAAQAGVAAVATADGVFVSADGEVWSRASRRWPSGAATAVALRETDTGFECWAILEGRVFGVALHRDGANLRAGEARQLVLPDAPSGNGPADVAFDIGGADAVVLFANALAVRGDAAGGWRVLRPTLTPGASIERLVAAYGSFWLATDRGLFVAAGLAERWRRVASPVGTQPVGALVGSADRLFAANTTAVREARARPPAPGSVRVAARIAAGDPPIEALQRAVLEYLDLEPSRMRELRRGVARRGWLPVVSLRVAGGGDRDRDIDYDDVFTSGERLELIDRRRVQGNDFDASLTLVWDLGEVVYHPEAIDVSREAREVLKLRDDVLDEVNQLYYERRAVRAQLAMASAALPPEEVLRLRLRAAELAAGLDAWTGGWFQRATRPGPP